MKKILNGPTVYRAKCPRCDCEFEYQKSDIVEIWGPGPDYYREIEYCVECPNCNALMDHDWDSKSPTSLNREETMSI